MKDSRIGARLKSAEGHLRGVQEMLDRDAYCIDVIRQVRAIQSALDRVNRLLLERHLDHCVGKALRSRDKGGQKRVLGELLDLFGGEMG
jgi:DNA-binding FrmR family transcriptional regulator